MEKVVVLAVLFLVTVVLGVSLNSGSRTDAGPIQAASFDRAREAQDTDADPSPAGPSFARGDQASTKSSMHNHVQPEPLRPEPVASNGASKGASKSSEVEAANPAKETGSMKSAGMPPSGVAGVADVEGATPGALEAAVDVAPRASDSASRPAIAPASAEQGLIRSMEGLIASPSPDFYYYAWSEGDSFTALAERFYGSTRHTALLLAANEGKSAYNLQPGDRIWIPVEEPGKQSGVLGNHYVVEEGDNLSAIAGKVYGNPGAWNRIFEANRDLMSDPNRLKVGMRLRIP
jgi:nucleoid-associated protein YgaU